MVNQESCPTEDKITILEQRVDSIDEKLTAILRKLDNKDVGNPSTDKPSGELNKPKRGFFEESAMPRVQLEKFDPSFPSKLIQWLMLMELFFSTHPLISDNEKIKIASLHLIGTAIQWVVWWNKQHTSFYTRTWEKFKESLISTYGEIGKPTPYAQFTRITQKGFVQQYNDEFRSLATLVEGIDNKQAVQIYLGGLKPEIQARLRTTIQSDDLEQAMEMAKHVEAEFRALRGPQYQRQIFEPSRRLDKEDIPKNKLDNTQTKRLTRAEVEEHMDKGTCFKCGRLWNKAHKCEDKTIHILECNDIQEEQEQWEIQEEVRDEITNEDEDIYLPQGLHEPCS